MSSRLPLSANRERIGLSTLEDISHLILQSHDLDETLVNIVRLVAARMQTEVCSIYLAEEEALVLRATVGLAAEAVGNTRLAMGEGLVGHTAKTCSVVNVDEPQSDERFCYVVNSDEEIYHSFLGIPLFDREKLLGVMAIQTIEKRKFEPSDISTLTTIGFQLSTVVANARLLDRLDHDQVFPTAMTTPDSDAPSQPQMSMVRGQNSFGGFAIGPAHLVDGLPGFAEIVDDEAGESATDFGRLDEAFAAARIETICLEKKIAERLDERDAAIFHSHLMILQDRIFIEKIKTRIQQGHGVVSAVGQVVSEYVSAFRQMQDPYLRERGADVEDVGRRLLAHLCGGRDEQRLELTRPGIVIARELLASDIAVMDLKQVRGLVLQNGDTNGHAVIIAKSLGIPTMIGADAVLAAVRPGMPLILDANTRTLHIEPSSTLRSEYERLIDDGKRQVKALQQFAGRDATTKDGVRVSLRANIGLRSDVDVAIENDADGVGLYRTELPYMARSSFPDRQTQYEIYRHVVEGFAGQAVTIRTLDIGGDKPLGYFEIPTEDNPFLGWRSVRVSLEHEDIFQTQIEAVYLAAKHGNVRLMFPMVTTVDEITQCKRVVNRAKQWILDQGGQVPDIPVGMMVETPATVMMLDQFAKHVDFFSLGTNDLIQYLLAADRGNAKVSHYYQSLHPAVLKAINQVVEIARRCGKPLSICGEMVGEPTAFAILVGLGLRDFSMSSPSILSTKAMLANHPIGDLQQLAQQALRCNNASEATKLAEDLIGAPPHLR